MTPEQYAALLETLASFDKRLATIAQDSADSAAAIEEMAKNMSNMNDSLGKVQDLYVSLDAKTDDNNAIVSNFVKETQGLRTESRQLFSEVRKKLASNG